MFGSASDRRNAIKWATGLFVSIGLAVVSVGVLLSNKLMAMRYNFKKKETDMTKEPQLATASVHVANDTIQDYVGYVKNRAGVDSDKYDYRSFCDEAVRHFNITTDPENPKMVRVDVYGFTVKEGRLDKTLISTYYVMPPCLPLNSEQYERRMGNLLANIDVEFVKFVKDFVAVRSDDYDSRYDLASDLVPILHACLSRYTAKLLKKIRK